MLRRSGRSAGIAPSAQTGPYHSLEIVCSNTPRKNNDSRSNGVEKLKIFPTYTVLCTVHTVL